MDTAGRAGPGQPDRGSVTVEAALALCALVVVLALAIGALLAVVAQLRCTDAAREAARLAARGEPESGRLAAVRIAPHGATVEIVVDGDEVRVRVGVVPVGGLLPGLQLAAEAFAVPEPAAGPDPSRPGSP